jgi:hypothetical protein
MAKEKESNKDLENNDSNVVSEEGIPAGLENASPQAQVAGRLAAAISPAVAREIMGGKISFAALTVIVDDKFSCTFPFYQVPTPKATEQEADEMKLNNAKSTMLAALEFSRTAGVFKNRSMQIFEDGYFGPPSTQ